MELTKVIIQGGSLRASIPVAVRDDLGLLPGEYLAWHRLQCGSWALQRVRPETLKQLAGVALP
jgi:hypothetical protein